MRSMPVLEAEGLTKEFRVFRRREGVAGAFRDLFHRRYEVLRAVDSATFRIERRERVGYIGPNGAGKSTTLKMLTGILFPTSGRVQVAGLDPHAKREESMRRIGAVFGQRSQLWWDLAPIEAFRLLGSIYGVGSDGVKRRLEEFEKPLEISALLSTPVRKLSLGQKMRCELAAALLHSPEVLFLDEPTIGLDLLAKEGIRRFLLEENQKRGTTFILTTHDLSDIEELCERVIIIDRGRILYDGSLRELKSTLGGGGALLFHLAPRQSGALRNMDSRNADPPNALGILHALTAGRPIAWSEEEGGAYRATLQDPSLSRADVIRWVLERFDVADVAMKEPRIEDVVRLIYMRSRSGEAKGP